MWEGTLRRDIFDIYVVAYYVVKFVGACLVCFLLGCSGLGLSSFDCCRSLDFGISEFNSMTSRRSCPVRAVIYQPINH